MPRGRRSRGLTLDHITRLEHFRRAAHPEHGCPHGYTYPQLLAAMQPMPFKLDTLLRAVAGKPVWEASHATIVQWLDRYLPALPAVRSGKDAAAGKEENGEPGELKSFVDRGRSAQEAVDKAIENAEESEAAARTLRGSR